MFEAIKQTFLEVPAWSWTLQAIGLVTAYAGAELNARMRIEGFHVWLASNVALAILHAASSLWLLLALDILFFRVNVIGIRKWKAAPPNSARQGGSRESETH